MAIDDLIQDATRRMDKSVEAAQHEFATLRTGRATPALLDRIQIDYYGTQTPLKQLATINAPEPRLLTIQPFDPNSVGQIERAIQESDLGLTPSNDGKLIRLPMKRVRTPWRTRSGSSRSIVSPKMSISESTSPSGRDQFSVENA